jgi:TolB-like protein
MSLKSARFIIIAITALVTAATAIVPDSASAGAAEPEAKPVVAAYVTGDVPDDMKNFFRTYMLTALANDGAGVNDETSVTFFNAAREEESKRNADVLDDSLICELGRNVGIRYVCVASINPVPGAFALSARVMSTKTGKSRYEGEFTGPLNTYDDFKQAIDIVVEKMFGGKSVFGGQPAPEQPKPEPKPAAAEQGKQIVAVYMAGEEPPNARGVHNNMGGELARVMSESDRYTAVDRTQVILEQLDREHVYQRSGAVDDAQIKSIGHQLGVEYLCISNINAVGKKYYLDTRLVDVVTAEIARSVTATSNLKDAGEMARVGRNIALELLEADKTHAQRARRKLIFRSTAISLDVLGVLAFAYGYIENNNVVKNIEPIGDGQIKNGPEADRAVTRRNAAYIVSGALLASGVSIHIVF